MDTIVTTLRLPRDLHDRLLLLQSERQKQAPLRRVTATEIVVEVVDKGLRYDAQVGAALLELQSAPTTEDGSSISATVRDRAVAALKGEGRPSPVPPCPKCGKELHWQCYGETGSAYCERHQTRIGPMLEPGCDFRSPIRRVGDRFEFCPQERNAMSVPLLGGEPVVNTAFVEEFGPVPEEFAGRVDAYGWTSVRPDGSPVSQTLTCRNRGPSSSRDWKDGAWGPWVTLVPAEVTP